jgi:hypothetical protein
MRAVARPVRFWPITEKRLCSHLRGRTGSFCSTKAFLLTSLAGQTEGSEAYCERAALCLHIVRTDRHGYLTCSVSASIEVGSVRGGRFSTLTDRLESGIFRDIHVRQTDQAFNKRRGWTLKILRHSVIFDSIQRNGTAVSSEPH